MNPNTHPGSVILPVTGHPHLDVVHRAEFAINVGYSLSVSGDGGGMPVHGRRDAVYLRGGGLLIVGERLIQAVDGCLVAVDVRLQAQQ